MSAADIGCTFNTHEERETSIYGKTLITGFFCSLLTLKWNKVLLFSVTKKCMDESAASSLDNQSRKLFALQLLFKEYMPRAMCVILFKFNICHVQIMFLMYL